MNISNRSRILTLSILAPFCIGAASGQGDAKVPDSKMPDIKIDASPLPQSAPSYAPVVEKVAPCVVTISSTKNVRRGQNPYFNDPTFRRFFGIPEGEEGEAPKRGNGETERKRKQAMGLGSGVVVSTDGHILTNNHVIDGADDIIVTIGSDKHEYRAKKIGGDAASDIAVLKIEGAKVQAITFADSDKVRIGDVVIAVGNPFGLTRSVSAGIVSSTGRGNLRMADYENYIQTDASINPGNSGGALVDSEGRLIGVNTSIYSRSGGNEGIGFAVPSNLARSVMEGLLRHGRVSRGFLGIGLQEVTEDLAKAFKLEGSTGALVNEVKAGGPADKAGIKNGDIVAEVNGKRVDSPRELQLVVAGLSPGSKVDVKIVRKGEAKSVSVELAERPGQDLASGKAPAKPADPDVLDGVTVGDVDADARKEFSLPEDAKGVVVTKVDPDSACADAGLKPGDLILEIEQEAVTSTKQAIALSEKLKKEKKVLLRISSKGTSRYVVVEDKE